MYQEEGLLFIIHTANRLAPLLLWAGVSGSRLWFHHNQSGKMSKIAVKRLSRDHIIFLSGTTFHQQFSAAVFDNLCNEKYAKVESLKKYVLAFASYQLRKRMVEIAMSSGMKCHVRATKPLINS